MSDNSLSEEKCDHNKFQRLKFFHGMLLDDKDLNIEQQYHIEKRKLHNRMLHGWGVVCGLNIEWEADAKSFIVTPGMALDCHGNEILVCDDVTVDLNDSSCLSSMNQVVATRQTSPRQHRQKSRNITTNYIGIRYQETPASPVPVYIPDDKCGKQPCANSRFNEGFCIDILDECPDLKLSDYGNQLEPLACLSDIFQNFTLMDKGSRVNAEALCEYFRKELENICKEPLPCPICCPDPHYVGLGKIEFYDNNCIKNIYPNDCRQYVLGNQLIQNSIYGLWCAIIKVNMDIKRLMLDVAKEQKTTVERKRKRVAKKSAKRKKRPKQQEPEIDEKE